MMPDTNDNAVQKMPLLEPITSIAGSSPTSQTHCPYRQASLLQQALASDKMRVAFFIGAGCPVAIRIADSEGTKPLIPDVKGLTFHISKLLKASADHQITFQKLLQRLGGAGKAEPNIEDILSYVRALRDVAGNEGIDGLSVDNLGRIEQEICRATTEVMKVRLVNDDTPYHQLATWVGGIRRIYPVEIFTSNYDLLIEQSLEERQVPYFDGFVGSDRTFFDLASIEQDNLPSRWARLWKVHGSINWWRTEKGFFERRIDGNPGDQQMIYPSHLKYEQSRRMPYLAMLDRIKAVLAHGRAVLVTCGYSFSDQHLNEVILQGLAGNPIAVCFGLLFTDRAQAPEAVAKARKHSNLRLLALDGAVLGTIEADWLSQEKVDHPLNGLAVRAGQMKERTSAPDERCKFLLGDFKSLGEFLASQIAYGQGEIEKIDGK